MPSMRRCAHLRVGFDFTQQRQHGRFDAVQRRLGTAMLALLREVKPDAQVGASAH